MQICNINFLNSEGFPKNNAPKLLFMVNKTYNQKKFDATRKQSIIFILPMS